MKSKKIRLLATVITMLLVSSMVVTGCNIIDKTTVTTQINLVEDIEAINSQEQRLSSIEDELKSLEDELKSIENELKSVGDDAQMQQLKLQTMAQEQQRVLSLMSALAKEMHDTIMAIINNIK
jgi:uncharacterized protein YlxW (UPF0749 family)